MNEKIVNTLKYNNFNVKNLNEKVHIIIGLIDNFCHEIKDLKIDKLLYDSLKSEFEINDLGIKEKSITFFVGSYEYENIRPCLNFDVYDISFYKIVLNLLRKMLKNFGK